MADRRDDLPLRIIDRAVRCDPDKEAVPLACGIGLYAPRDARDGPFVQLRFEAAAFEHGLFAFVLRRKSFPVFRFEGAPERPGVARLGVQLRFLYDRALRARVHGRFQARNEMVAKCPGGHQIRYARIVDDFPAVTGALALVGVLFPVAGAAQVVPVIAPGNAEHDRAAVARAAVPTKPFGQRGVEAVDQGEVGLRRKAAVIVCPLLKAGSVGGGISDVRHRAQRSRRYTSDSLPRLSTMKTYEPSLS